MEENEEYHVEGESPEEQKVCPVCEQSWEPVELAEGDMPPSILILRFAGPGSALVQMMGHGVVTREQIGAAILRLLQDWAVPIMQMVSENTVAAFMAEVSKPRISTPGGPPPFFMPGHPGKPL